MINWTKISEDRKKKEWIVHGPKHNQQLSRISKKKKIKILAEHWLLQKVEGKTHTEISKCKGCENRTEQSIDNCERWIRRNNNIKAVPETLVEKGSNKINATLEQILENRTTEEWKKEERGLIELKQVEELEIELIKKQKFDSKVTNYLIEAPTKNKRRNKDKYTLYTNGALYKEEKKNSTGKMGIGWVQVSNREDWPEEEMALGLDGWPSATTAELAAIWLAILVIPEGKYIEVHTDSLIALRHINRAIQEIEVNKVLRKKYVIWIMNIADMVHIRSG